MATINPNLEIFDKAVALIESTPCQSKVLSSGEVLSYRVYNPGMVHTIVMIPGYCCDDILFSVRSDMHRSLMFDALHLALSLSAHAQTYISQLHISSNDSLSPYFPSLRIIPLLPSIHVVGMDRVWTQVPHLMRYTLMILSSCWNSWILRRSWLVDTLPVSVLRKSINLASHNLAAYSSEVQTEHPTFSLICHNRWRHCISHGTQKSWHDHSLLYDPFYCLEWIPCNKRRWENHKPW